MKMAKYNLIKGPKTTVSDYVHSLNDDELKTIYSSGFFYDLKIPDLMKKLAEELHKRKLDSQPALF